MGEVVRQSQGADLAALLEAAAAQDSGTAYRYRRRAPRSQFLQHVSITTINLSNMRAYMCEAQIWNCLCHC